MQNIVAEDEGSRQGGHPAAFPGTGLGGPPSLPRTSVKGKPAGRPLPLPPGGVCRGWPLTWLHTIPVLKGGSWPSFLAGWLWRRIWTPLLAIAKGARYQFRVVSLDGQVVQRRGSLTGGSTAKSAGAPQPPHRK